MKTMVNHKEMAEQLKAQAAELQDRNDNKYLEARAQGDASKAFDDEYWANKKQLEDLAREIHFHEVMAQDKKYASEHLWSDVHAYEIIEEKSDKLILVRQLKATRTLESMKAMQESFVPGGFMGHFDNSLQDWTFEVNEKNPIIEIRKHKDGHWYAKGKRYFSIEHEPYEHYDFNF